MGTHTGQDTRQSMLINIKHANQIISKSLHPYHWTALLHIPQSSI